MEPIEKKLVVIGDGACGKTCLVFMFDKNEFYQGYVPTIFENYKKNVQLGEGRSLNLDIYDTADHEDYDRLRPLTYTNADVFLLCFSIENSDSLKNVEYKWIEELKHYCPSVPFILVGNKKDLRDDPATIRNLRRFGKKTVGEKEGRAMAKKIKANAYMECSAKRNAGVGAIFDKAVELSIRPPRRVQKKCVLL